MNCESDDHGGNDERWIATMNGTGMDTEQESKNEKMMSRESDKKLNKSATKTKH